jgi:hypothetical protein
MLKEIADRVHAAGAGRRALDQNIDTTTAEGRLFFQSPSGRWRFPSRTIRGGLGWLRDGLFDWAKG